MAALAQKKIRKLPKKMCSDSARKISPLSFSAKYNHAVEKQITSAAKTRSRQVVIRNSPLWMEFCTNKIKKAEDW